MTTCPRILPTGTIRKGNGSRSGLGHDILGVAGRIDYMWECHRRSTPRPPPAARPPQLKRAVPFYDDAAERLLSVEAVPPAAQSFKDGRSGFEERSNAPKTREAEPQ